jgi:tetratricopeptide (TPR) repeat protein
MKTLASESYTVAWFKIADFVSRGEKERALHMYPLLMHSISEPAISYQLEGDILLSFDDMTALECYRKAVELYKKSGKVRQAIGVYEHASLFVDDEKIFKELLDLYIICDDSVGFNLIFSKLAKFYLHHGYQSVLSDFVEFCKELMPIKFVALVYANYIRLLMMYGLEKNNLGKELEFCLELFLKSFEINNNLEKEFHKFLSELKVLHPLEFEKIQKVLCKKS